MQKDRPKTYRLPVPPPPFFIFHSSFSISSSDMDRRAALGVALGAAQHLVGQRGGVALAEEDVAREELQGVALGPAEVGVRALAGYLISEEGRRFVLVAFINHPNAAGGRDALDALVQSVYRRTGD